MPYSTESSLLSNERGGLFILMAAHICMCVNVCGVNSDGSFTHNVIRKKKWMFASLVAILNDDVNRSQSKATRR